MVSLLLLHSEAATLAGLMEFFEKNFSVDAIKRYKPAPEPYRMVAAALGVEPGNAMQDGCYAAFISRKRQALFPLVKPPD